LGHVLKEFKDQPDALYEMGRINFAREEYGHASQYFERALKALQKLDPKQRANFEGGWARDLGVAYQRGGNDKAAVQVFVRSQQIRPDVSIGKFLNKYWNQTEGTHLKQAIALQKSGKDKEAEKIYRQILPRDANNGEALHFLGCILLNKTDFKEAEVLLRRAITLNPASAVYHRNLAALHIRTKRPEEALRLWRHALTLDTIEEGHDGKPRRTVVWLLKDAQIEFKATEAETISQAEFLKRWNDREWLAANPDHPISYVRVYQENLSSLRNHIKSATPTIKIVRGGRAAFIPANATEAERSKLLSKL
jgi:Flp pilus assembly protein TadD